MTANMRTARSWTALRKRALTPRFCSDLRTTQADRDEFLRGAELLRFYGDRALRGHQPLAQQLLVADMLAAGEEQNVILLPRRSSKSTSVIAVGLGRAEAREDYRVGILTLSSGKAGRSRFLKDVAPAIERLFPDRHTRPLKIVKSAGQERIEFPNGSFVQWLSTVDDIRGEAFDMLLLDEAGEANPEKTEEVLSAALSTMDTRPGAQIIAAGTAGRFKEKNLLHDWLEEGRRGIGGILDYSVDETLLSDAMLAAWEPTEEHPQACVKQLVLDSHPGVASKLTTISTIQKRFESLPLEKFLREYLGIFEDVGSGGLLIRPRTWLDAGTSAPLPSPDHYALALACHPDQAVAAVVAAWRDAEGIGHIIVDRHGRGTDWVAGYLQKFGDKRKVVGFDTFSAVAQVEIQKLTRMRGRIPQLDGFNTPAIKQAAALLVDDLNNGRLIHYQQAEMDEAARIAVKRKIGPSGWGLGRAGAEDDIVALEAAAIALKLFDQLPVPRKITPMVSGT